jgi:O-methyltransferase
MKSFDEVWGLVSDDNILGHAKSLVMYDVLALIENIPGMMIELGVYKGRTAKLMWLCCPEKELFLFDTFCGVAGSNCLIDKVPDGEFSESLDKVRHYLGEDRVKYFPGFFPDSFKVDTNQMFALVHSDMDTYHGAKASLELLWPLVSPGGVFILDDYQWVLCPGIEKAVHEFMELNHALDLTVIGNQAYFRKPF